MRSKPYKALAMLSFSTLDKKQQSPMSWPWYFLFAALQIEQVLAAGGFFEAGGS